MVTENTRGTARYNMRGLVFKGRASRTAESGSGKSHAWFAGYTLNKENTGLPDIAITVIVENIGEGSDYAVPIFRYLVEAYYYQQSGRFSYPLFNVGQPLPTPTPFGNPILRHKDQR